MMNHIARYRFLAAYGAFALIMTGIFGFTYLAVQQNYRQSANDPQIQMAEDAARALDSGTDPAALMPSQKIDIRNSLSPFLIIFDDSQKPVAASGYLDGQIPILPYGVLDYVRNYGEDRITWQPAFAKATADKPALDARIAAVITRYNSGFVLAGRSLREVEVREEMLGLAAAFGWASSLALLAIGMYFVKIKSG